MENAISRTKLVGFKSVLEQAEYAFNHINAHTFEDIIMIIKNYNKLCFKIRCPATNSEIRRYKINIEEIYVSLNTELSRDKDNVKSRLLKIITESKQAIEYLTSILTPISKLELDKLTQLKQELNEIYPNLQNAYLFDGILTESINEYEVGHHHASALLSAKVIDNILAQIPGNINEKIIFLKDKEIIPKDSKPGIDELILKANLKARNVTTHDLSVTPSPSDATSLLGDVTKLLRLYAKLELSKST